MPQKNGGGKQERARSKTGLAGIQGPSQRQPLRPFRPLREYGLQNEVLRDISVMYTTGTRRMTTSTCVSTGSSTGNVSDFSDAPKTRDATYSFRHRRSLAGWHAGNGKESSPVDLTPRGLSLTKILSVPVSPGPPAIDDGPGGRSVAQEWLAAQARTFSTTGLGSSWSTFWHSDEVGIWNF